MNYLKDTVKEMVDIQEFLKAGFRTGDDAPMAVIELIDRNPEAKKIDKPKKVEGKKKKENKEFHRQQVNKQFLMPDKFKVSNDLS